MLKTKTTIRLGAEVIKALEQIMRDKGLGTMNATVNFVIMEYYELRRKTKQPS